MAGSPFKQCTVAGSPLEQCSVADNALSLLQTWAWSASGYGGDHQKNILFKSIQVTISCGFDIKYQEKNIFIVSSVMLLNLQAFRFCFEDITVNQLPMGTF